MKAVLSKTYSKDKTGPFYPGNLSRRPKCPKCSDKTYVRWIVYGTIDIDDLNKIDFDKYTLGGCMFEEWQWDCSKCQVMFYFEK